MFQYGYTNFQKKGYRFASENEFFHASLKNRNAKLAQLVNHVDTKHTAYDNKLVFDTFAKAVQSNPDTHPIFHSDRGFQYTNRYFYQRLVNAGMTQSMSRVGRCIDNGPMEGFWGILKRERYYGRRFTNRAELVKMIRSYIHYYNTKRLQRNLGVLTPLEKHDLYLKAA